MVLYTGVSTQFWIYLLGMSSLHRVLGSGKSIAVHGQALTIPGWSLSHGVVFATGFVHLLGRVDVSNAGGRYGWT
jgi:hypothetical protein